MSLRKTYTREIYLTTTLNGKSNGMNNEFKQLKKYLDIEYLKEIINYKSIYNLNFLDWNEFKIDEITYDNEEESVRNSIDMKKEKDPTNFLKSLNEAIYNSTKKTSNLNNVVIRVQVNFSCVSFS